MRRRRTFAGVAGKRVLTELWGCRVSDWCCCRWFGVYYMGNIVYVYLYNRKNLAFSVTADRILLERFRLNLVLHFIRYVCCTLYYTKLGYSSFHLYQE